MINPVPEKTGIGVRIPFSNRRRSATRSAPFFVPPVYGGPFRASSEGRTLLPGNANPVRPATFIRRSVAALQLSNRSLP